MNYPDISPHTRFTLPNDIVNDLHDICLELEDVGFTVQISNADDVESRFHIKTDMLLVMKNIIEK